MLNHHTVLENVESPGVLGSMISIMSGITSFTAHELPVVQFFAAIVAIITGIMSTAWVIKRWRDGRP